MSEIKEESENKKIQFKILNCYNFFPEEENIIHTHQTSIDDNGLCLSKEMYMKQKERVKNKKFWKVFTNNYYTSENLKKIKTVLEILNKTNEINSTEILYAICIENGKCNIIWSDDIIKNIYFNDAAFTIAQLERILR